MLRYNRVKVKVVLTRERPYTVVSDNIEGKSFAYEDKRRNVPVLAGLWAGNTVSDTKIG
jgi:hypothetical protein